LKNPLRDLSLPAAVVIASVVIGASIVCAAAIIGESIKTKEINTTLRRISDFTKTINRQKSGLLKDAGEGRKMPEAAGSKKIEGITPGINPIKGNINAPVLMVEFSDFQCPFSKKFYQQAFPQIEKEYINTGKVKFAYRDFPLASHQFAKSAAIAARCAGEQGRYWQMFDKLLSGSSLDKETLDKYAQELKLDIKAYEACQAKPAVLKAVESDSKDAAKFGVQGTPSFFINGRFVNGAYPFETFKKIIEEELAKSAKEK